MSKVLNHPFLPILGLSSLVAWITWQRLTAWPPAGPDQGWKDSLHLLIAAAYASLILGSLGLRRSYYLIRKKPIRPFSFRSAIILAFLLPLFVTLVPSAVENLPFVPELFNPAELTLSLQIWLPALQGFTLGCLLLLGERFTLANFETSKPDLSWWAVGLAGLGLWLAGSYSYQLAGLLNPGGEMGGFLVSPTRIWISAGLVLALPILEGLFFRGRLLPFLQNRTGTTAGILICAGISAGLSLQPILWIPAFLAGTGFNFLAARKGGLRVSIYAHAIFNTLALLILPGLIL